ncbi:hypothetical protein C8Q77DRAFT_38037 [Trametes polyzona]|nr:hypothetical protein C8Q77DRAFT_38037 [Trametes polyzona]
MSFCAATYSPLHGPIHLRSSNRGRSGFFFASEGRIILKWETGLISETTHRVSPDPIRTTTVCVRPAAPSIVSACYHCTRLPCAALMLRDTAAGSIWELHHARTAFTADPLLISFLSRAQVCRLITQHHRPSVKILYDISKASAPATPVTMPPSRWAQCTTDGSCVPSPSGLPLLAQPTDEAAGPRATLSGSPGLPGSNCVGPSSAASR